MNEDNEMEAEIFEEDEGIDWFSVGFRLLIAAMSAGLCWPMIDFHEKPFSSTVYVVAPFLVFWGLDALIRIGEIRD